MLKLSQRLFLLAAGTVAFGGSACGSDDVVPLEPVTYELSIDAYNGRPGDVVALRCDGTISVTVTIGPTNAFLLRPLNACGTSPRCGYVHFEALDAEGDVVASADSVTLEGVLRVTEPERTLDGGSIRVSLRSGIDGEPIVNADGTKAEARAEPGFEPAGSCEETGGGGAGGGGSGGAPSEPAVGGAGGASESGSGGAGGDSSLGGAGGDSSLGGAAGDSSLGGAGGAPSGAGAGGA